MKSSLNKQRRKKARRERDQEKRRARHLGLEEVPKNRRLKQRVSYGWVDHRPNKTTGPEKP